MQKKEKIMEYKTHKCINKISKPILTKDDIPYDASLVFNAGVAKYNGKYFMIFRNDYGVSKEEFESGKNGWEERWQKRYTAGIMLLDLNDPYKVVGICKEPLIVADEAFEQDGGFRQNVIFPGGMIAEDDSTVKIYYGASDTVECVATAKIEDLINLCTEEL